MKLHSLTIVIIIVLQAFWVRMTMSERNAHILISNEKSYSQQEKNDKGIGPIKNIKLGTLDLKMAAKGKNLFNSKCLLCHDLDQKKIGPPLRDITKIRTPEFIMNQLLNTTQMQKEDQIIKDLIAVYKIPMTPQELSADQARAILEYLRSVNK